METQWMIKLQKFEYELFIIDFLNQLIILSEMVLCIEGGLILFFLIFFCF